MALNFGPPVMNFEALGSLGKTFFDAQAAAQKRGIDQQSQALLGEAAKSGDYARAGQTLIGLGRVQEGAALLGLAQKEREQKLQEEAYKTSPFSSSAAPRAPSSPTGPTVPLGQSVVAPRGVQFAGSEEDVQRLEAEASGQTQFGQRSQPRGLRNNNPGNIESGKFAATVQGFQGSDGRFAQYATPEQGIQAADKLLTTYAARGLNTVEGIVNRWAPPTENNTGAYVAQVAKELGVDPSAPLDMNNPAVRQRLIAAKIRVENGRQPYSEDVFQRALNPNWQTEVASFEGGGNEQPAQASQPLGGGGVYAGVDEGTLNGYLNNPRVPPNLKALVQQELASRQGGAPVQVAQAPAMPGAPVADAPAPGAVPVQGFAVPPGQAGKLPENDPFPQVTNEQLVQVIRNPRSSPGDKALAQQLFASRQAYASETAPEKREQTRLETQKKSLEVKKLEREVAGVLTPEQEAQKIRLARAGRAVNEAPIPPGYRAIRDAEGQLERVEPIPGSKQEREVKALDEKKAKADVMRAETGNVVANALDDIDRLSAGSSLPVAGAIGSRISSIPGTAAHDVAKSLETVGANISFGQLQQMRESSPTGGALGAVTERELDLLKNSFASLSQTQSVDQFKTNLGRVRATFERIVHGRTLTPTERKTGGPMTPERAQSIREEAAKAIAAGAPRNEVMKRLSQDYGLTPEGM
jgi:hypothetical protein